MAEVTLQRVNKRYDNGFHAVKDLTLGIADGEFLVLVGPSGCGKTTALRMVAGLEDISDGTISIGDRVVNDVSPKDRDIAMVFQSYALYPHLTVADNIAYGLRMRKMPKQDIKTRVQQAAQMLDLDPLLDRKPAQLSGGQRQRVAMGRAIVRQPQVFLMDEPLSNLDAKLRVQMRADIAQLQRELKTTTIYVTHDQIEAMTMGDRVAVMKFGVLQQCNAPQALYDDPDNLFVAGFIGSPPMNMCLARVDVNDGNVVLDLGHDRLAVDPERVVERPAIRSYAGRTVAVGVRSEDMEDATIAREAPPDRRLRAAALLTEALGSEIVVRFGVDAQRVQTQDTAALDQDARTEEQGRLGAQPETQWVASFGPRSRVRIGDQVEIAVDTGRLHFFDADTGAAIRS